MNIPKIKQFINAHKQKINENPLQFLRTFYEASGKNGLSSAEEDYIAYLILYQLGIKNKCDYKFYISTEENTPIGFSIERTTPNSRFEWYSDLNGDESLEWLESLGWLRDYLDLPIEVVRYFRQFPVKRNK